MTPGCAGGVLAVALTAAVAYATPASAMDFKFGDVSLNLRTTASAGAGMRVSNPDGDLISVNNGGRDTTVAAENFDDGNLNFRRGDIYSASTRVMHEFDLQWQNLGAFASVAYFYDFVNNKADSTRRTDLSHDARGQAGRGFDLYDAYVYGDFDIGGAPLTVRAGNQVINWGEAMFRSGGISQTNANDLGKLVTPGTNIREAYLPSPMIYANLGLVPGVSLEAYYQFTWRKTELQPVGTFHSTEDLLADGAQGMFFLGDPGSTGLTPQQMFMAGMGIPRLADDQPRNSGQWGVAARYYAEDISTEASLYYLRYHAKTPYVSGAADMIPVLPPFVFIPGPVGYYAYYPEDIDLYGASLSFPLGPVAIGAEAAFQPDYPVMLADAITDATVQTTLTGLPTRINGFTPADRWNFDVNAAISIGPSLDYIGALPGFIGADSIDLIGEAQLVSFSGAKPVGVTGDMSAWGVTLVANATYTNVLLSGMTVTPGVTFNYDVNGVAIDRSSAGTPIEGKRALSLGVTADYQKIYSVGLNYTNNMGGGLITRSSDRDFVTITASYSF